MLHALKSPKLSNKQQQQQQQLQPQQHASTHQRFHSFVAKPEKNIYLPTNIPQINVEMRKKKQFKHLFIFLFPVAFFLSIAVSCSQSTRLTCSAAPFFLSAIMRDMSGNAILFAIL